MRKREIREVIAGEGRAFDCLYADYAPRVLGYLRLLTGNRATEEDLLQETFLAAYSGRISYKGTASPGMALGHRPSPLARFAPLSPS